MNSAMMRVYYVLLLATVVLGARLLNSQQTCESAGKYSAETCFYQINR